MSRCPTTSQVTRTGCVSATSSDQSLRATSNAVSAPAATNCRDPVEAVRVKREPLGDQGAVVRDRWAVTGVARRQRHHLGLAQVRQVLQQRPATLVARQLRRHDLCPGGDVRKQVVTDERVAMIVVDEERVGRAVPWTEDGAQRQSTGLDAVAVREHTVGREVRAVLDDVVEERRRRRRRSPPGRRDRASALR